MRNLLILLTSAGFLTGCSASLNHYRGNEPRLALDRFFNGELVAHGIVQDYSGKVIRRFRADIQGRWQGDRGVLDERFEFSDGEIQTRCWQLRKDGDRYTGSAGDVVGEARGEAAGNALNWRYRLRVSVGEREWVLALDDWMYLVDETHLINRTRMRKFGLTVGELTLHIQKLSDAAGAPLDPACQPD